MLARLFVIALFAAVSAFGQVAYPAAQAFLSGGATVTDRGARNIGLPSNGAVTFGNVVAARGGLYPVTVNASVYDDRVLGVTVNNGIRQWFSVRRASRRGDAGSKTLLLPLQPGTNTIRFDNPREAGTELDNIVVSENPVESFRIAGTAPPRCMLRLTGPADRQTTADFSGHYQFPFLSPGAYYVTPLAPRLGSRYVELLRSNCDHIDIPAAAKSTAKPAKLRWGPWRIECNGGLATIWQNNVLLLSNVYSEARLPDPVATMDFAASKVGHHSLRGQFGRGEQFIIKFSNPAGCNMTQTFSLYPEFLTAQVSVSSNHPLRSRFVAPLMTHAPGLVFPQGDNRALYVPFDNDKWDRYAGVPFGESLQSFEASALYNTHTRAGVIIGSIDHDTWKTSVELTTAGDSLADLQVYAGVASPLTRDTLPHGEVFGNTISSPRIFLGRFDDWRDGLETYARANAAVTPPPPWSNGVPFGWNSWGKIQFKLTYDKATNVSHFIATKLEPRGFEDNGVVYLGLDAGWNQLTETQIRNFVDCCHTNGQQPGIYCTPWAHFGRPNDPVDGSQYHYCDLFLLANGQPQRIAGGYALDPTHPGTREVLRRLIEKFEQAGFTYLKIDFLVQGSLEGDHFYDPSITTGLQAYNSGMKYLRSLVGGKMYLNEAISPAFPACYAQSRRIACDAFGAISETEYTLNALSYGWWFNGIYRYLDPDLLVLQGYTPAENRSRVTSGVITGLMTAGDDFTLGGREAMQFLTNDQINRLARSPKMFRPVEGNEDAGAAQLFVGTSEGKLCLAVFNYSNAPADIPVNLRRIGWAFDAPAIATELWRGTTEKVNRSFTVHLASADSALYRFDPSER